MFTTGIDQHKRESVFTTYNAAGERVRLSDLLLAQGIDLQLAHAKALKAIAYAKVKTDPIDSDRLAVLRQAGFIPQAHMIAPELRGPRDLLRTRLRLVTKSTSCRNSMPRLLEKFNVPTVEQLSPIYQLQAACHTEQRALLAGQIHRLEQELNPAVLPATNVQRLLWIPGIGKRNAGTIALEIDDIARFPSGKRFVCYFRLVPGADNSGATPVQRSGSKDGNRYLKIAFVRAAVRAIQYSPEIRTFYRRLARRKNPKVARTIIARPRPHRLPGPDDHHRVQRDVPRPGPQSYETVAVAATGTPGCLTESVLRDEARARAWDARRWCPLRIGAREPRLTTSPRTPSEPAPNGVWPPRAGDAPRDTRSTMPRTTKGRRSTTHRG
jgi:transposase